MEELLRGFKRSGMMCFEKGGYKKLILALIVATEDTVELNYFKLLLNELRLAGRKRLADGLEEMYEFFKKSCLTNPELIKIFL